MNRNNIRPKNPLKHSDDSEYKGNPYLYQKEFKDTKEITTFRQPRGTALISDEVSIHRKYQPSKFEEIIKTSDKNVFSIGINLNDNFIISDEIQLKSIGSDFIKFSDEFGVNDFLETDIEFSLESPKISFKEDFQASFTVFNQDSFELIDYLNFEFKNPLMIKDNAGEVLEPEDNFNFHLNIPIDEGINITDGLKTEIKMEKFEDITRDSMMILRDKFNAELSKANLNKKSKDSKFTIKDEFSFDTESDKEELNSNAEKNDTTENKINE